MADTHTCATVDGSTIKIDKCQEGVWWLTIKCVGVSSPIMVVYCPWCGVDLNEGG